MSRLFIFLLPLILAGCASSQIGEGPNVYNLANINDIRTFISNGGDVNQKDEFGRTPLHYAVSRYTDAVPILLNAGAALNVQDKDGFTPLHLASKYQTSVIRMLLMSGADVSIESSGVGRCHNRRRVIFEDVNPYQLAMKCNNSIAISIFEGFASESDSWHSAMALNTYQAYASYTNKFPSGMFLSEANARYKELRHRFIEALKTKQPCSLKEEGWYYTSGGCKDGFANKFGKAVSLEGEMFQGEFLSGWRKQGRLVKESKVVFDGPYLLGSPHGQGVCRFEGELEECHMYKGERVGSLYKQRTMFITEIKGLRNDIARLERSIYSQSNRAVNSSSTNDDYSYLAHLNSKDKSKRTVSRIKAAVDLLGLFTRAATKND